MKDKRPFVFRGVGELIREGFYWKGAKGLN